MRIALDTSILAGAEGIDGVAKRDLALDLVRRLRLDATVIPVQVLGELFGILVRQTSRSRDEAREALLGWSDTFPAVETSTQIMQAATDIAKDHEFRIWEAVVLATASHAGCRLLLSENLEDGFTWGGVTIVNPFAMPRHALLKNLWNEASG